MIARTLIPAFAVALVPLAGVGDSTPKSASPIAFVSVQRVIAQDTSAQAAAKKIQTLRDEKTKAIAQKQKELEAARLEVARSGGMFKATRRAEMLKQAERLDAELRKLREESQTELQNLQHQAQTDVQKGINDAMTEVLKSRRNVDIVLNSDASVVWARGGMDLTADVVAAMNKKQGQGAKP